MFWNARSLMVSSWICLVLAALRSPVGVAQASAEPASDWQIRSAVYLYVPEFSSRIELPGGAFNLTKDMQDVIDETDKVFMGAMSARRNRFSLFTDFLYNELSGERSGLTALPGGVPALPPDLSLNLKSETDLLLWTAAAGYDVHSNERHQVDIIAGLRFMHMKSSVDYQVGSPAGPLLAGGIEDTTDNFDVIVGLKGRRTFGSDSNWFVDYYGDIGAGGSDLTWQAFVSGGRRLGRYEVVVGYRHMDYELSDGMSDHIDFNGPVFGASTSW